MVNLQNLALAFPSLGKLGRAAFGEIPIVHQTMATDCGAACLAMVLAYHGRHVTLEKVRSVMTVGRDGVTARVAEYAELEAKPAAAPAGSLNQLLDVSVGVTAEIGRTTLSIADVLKLGSGSVVNLDRAVSEPIDLLVQGVPFARGEVVVIEDRFAIRIREIVDTKLGAKK